MSFSIQRIRAVFFQEFFITKRSLEVFMDILVFPVVNVVLFGLVSLFLESQANQTVAHYLIMGAMLWEMFRISQYTISVTALWEIWSRNLSNMFVTPLADIELLIAYSISAIVKSLVLFLLFSVISKILFNFEIYSIGLLNLFLIFLNLIFFGISTGILLISFIFRYGTKIQAITWGIVYLLQPLTAAFFPVSILPKFLQYVAYSLPITYVFEAARNGLTSTTILWQNMAYAFLLNIIYLVIFLSIFRNFVEKAKRSGQFAKNEG